MPVNFLNNILLPDNARLAFGDSWDGTNADLDIYHDGTGGHSYISDQGTGHLQILSSQVQINNAANSANMATFASGGSVTLYNNGSSKMSTSSTGISITGGFTTTSSSDCAGLNMTSDIAMGSNDITDSNSSAGSAGQVLSSLGAGNGTDWIDAATGTVTGTGVSSRVSYWNGTSSQTSTAGFTFDGSNFAVPGNITATAGSVSAGTSVSSTTTMSAGTTMTIGTIAEVGSDTDKFLMSDSGVVKYVTGANLRSYIGAGTGSGTVTSVAATAGTGISISGSPITSSGTLTITNTAPETFSGWIVRDDDGDDKTLSGSTNKYLKFEAATGSLGTNLSGTGTTSDPYVMTITSPDSDSGGTVTSVTLAAGTGISLSGTNPITSSGTITITNTAPQTTTGTVTSINVKTDGDAMDVASNSVTSSGTCTIPWQGTSSQYVNGEGNLTALSTLPQGTVTSVGITAGTGISVSGSPVTGSGNITVTNTAPNVAETFTGWVIRDDDGDDKTLSGSTNKYLKVTMANGTAGTNLSGTGTTGDPYVLALTSPGDSGGTVTSVDTAGTVNGLTLTGGEITTSGTITLGGTLAINNGDWSGTDLSVANGGTGRSTLSSGQVLLGNGTSGINSRAIGISDDNIVEIDSASVADNDYARFTANGLEGRSYAEVRSDIGAGTGDGTVTSVSGGDGLTGTVTSSGSLAVDYSTSTSNVIGAASSGTPSGSAAIIFNDSGGVNKIAFNSLNISLLNNDAGFTTNSGTVTSVAVTVGTGLDVSGSPITSSGTIDIDLDLNELNTIDGEDPNVQYLVVVDGENANGKITPASLAEWNFLALSGGTVTGDVVLSSSAVQMKRDISANTTSGLTLAGGSSTSLTVNKIYYLSDATTWTEASNTSATTGKGLLGYAYKAGSMTTNGITLQGVVYDSSHGYAVGSPLYLSSGGGMTTTPPTTSTHIARIVGYAISADEIYFDPDKTWILLD